MMQYVHVLLFYDIFSDSVACLLDHSFISTFIISFSHLLSAPINPSLTLEIQCMCNESRTHSSTKNEFIPLSSTIYDFKSTFVHVHLLIIASNKRSPQTILGQQDVINSRVRFFPICPHSWDACVLHKNMQRI